jgi:hypothetical protein
MISHDDHERAVARKTVPESSDEHLRELWERLVGRRVLHAEEAACDRGGRGDIGARRFGREWPAIGAQRRERPRAGADAALLTFVMTNR